MRYSPAAWAPQPQATIAENESPMAIHTADSVAASRKLITWAGDGR